MLTAMLAILLHSFSPVLANALRVREPHIVCYQIGDNQYSCDAYWE